MSRLAIGSSRSIQGVVCATARAITIFCFSPPLKIANFLSLSLFALVSEKARKTASLSLTDVPKKRP